MQDGEDLLLYSLLLPPGTAVEAEKIATALQDELGLHRSEALPRALYGGGVLANRESYGKLEKLAATIKPLGATGNIVHSAELENLPRPRRTSGLDFNDVELIAQAPSGKRMPVPRSSLSGIRAIALLPENPAAEEEDTAASPLHSSTLEPPRESHQEEECQRRLRVLVERLNDPGLKDLAFQLRLYATSPLAVLKIDKDEFDYSCLGENKSDNSLENYLRLLEKLLGWMPGSGYLRQVEDFLNDPDPLAILLSGDNEVACSDRSLLWHLENAATGEPSGIKEDPSTEAGS